MNTFIIPALTVALPSIGFIAGALFAGSKNQSLRDKLASYQNWSAADNQLIRKLGRELAEARALIFGYEATERARTSGLRASNAKRSAEATASRHLRMEAAEQRSAMKQAAE